MRRFLIREASLAEIEDIKQFYKDHPDDHVMLRDDEAIIRAIKEGVFFIAIDTDKESASRIIGASAVYTVPAKSESGLPLTLKEAGGSNMSSDYKGFGIHKVFHAARSLHKFILDYGGFDEYFGAIICPNPPSVANIEKMGFEVWRNVAPSLVHERAIYADKSKGQEIRYWRLPTSSLQYHAQRLLELETVMQLERKLPDGSTEIVETHLALDTLKLYKPVLQMLAEGKINEALGDG